MKTYYIHPMAFGSTKNPGYGHVPVVKADEAEKLRAKLEAAEKRIAELEAREVTLPKVQNIHPLGPQSAHILCEFHRNIVNRCADEIRKIGVKVSIKGD